MVDLGIFGTQVSPWSPRTRSWKHIGKERWPKGVDRLTFTWHMAPVFGHNEVSWDLEICSCFYSMIYSTAFYPPCFLVLSVEKKKGVHPREICASVLAARVFRRKKNKRMPSQEMMSQPSAVRVTFPISMWIWFWFRPPNGVCWILQEFGWLSCWFLGNPWKSPSVRQANPWRAQVLSDAPKEEGEVGNEMVVLWI